MTEWSEIMTNPRYISFVEFSLKLLGLLVLSGIFFVGTIVARKQLAYSTTVQWLINGLFKTVMQNVTAILRPLKVIWLPVVILTFGLIIPMNFIGQCLWPYSSWEFMNLITGLVTFLLVIRCIMILFKIHLKGLYDKGPKLLKEIKKKLEENGCENIAKFFSLTVLLTILFLNFMENFLTCAVLTRHMGFGLIYGTIFVSIIAWMTVDAFEALDTTPTTTVTTPAPTTPAGP